MATSTLTLLAAGLSSGRIRVVDLTQTLAPEFPQIVLPPEFGQAWPFRIEEASRYDDRGPAWYWNNFSCGEHTGTHFDAPIHWISGRDLPNNATDTIPVQELIGPACVIDCSRETVYLRPRSADQRDRHDPGPGVDRSGVRDRLLARGCGRPRLPPDCRV